MYIVLIFTVPTPIQHTLSRLRPKVNALTEIMCILPVIIILVHGMSGFGVMVNFGIHVL